MKTCGRVNRNYQQEYKKCHMELTPFSAIILLLAFHASTTCITMLLNVADFDTN